MNRPNMSKFPPEGGIDLGTGPHAPAGFLIDVSSGMRTFRPVIDADKCVKCLRCFLMCPDGAVDKSGELPEIDYDYCKGCGVCSKACRPGAISMIKESDV